MSPTRSVITDLLVFIILVQRYASHLTFERQWRVPYGPLTHHRAPLKLIIEQRCPLWHCLTIPDSLMEVSYAMIKLAGIYNFFQGLPFRGANINSMPMLIGDPEIGRVKKMEKLP